MGLKTLARGWREALEGCAARRPHVLLVPCPGGTGARMAAEAAVARLGGTLAPTPADADVLLVVGEPSGELCEAVESLWAQMPGPRVRGRAVLPEAVGGVLEGLVPRLSGAEQVRDAAGRDDEWSARQEQSGEHAAQRGGNGTHQGHDEDHHNGGPGAHDAEEQDDGEGEHQEGGTGGHGGHGMRMPGGLGMAETVPDRDGLTLDALHVALGPVLPEWPTGLVLDTVLQGDVVQEARGRVLASSRASGTVFWSDAGEPATRRRRTAACYLDSMGRLLAVAGWQAAARRARALRDQVLAAEPDGGLRTEFARWRRRVERSALLRWSTDGVGVLSPERATRLGVGGPAARAGAPGDVSARWRQWLVETDALLSGAPVPEEGPRGGALRGGGPPSQALLDAVLELLPGLELAAARLVVASFDPDPDEWCAVPPSPVRPEREENR
ncbi:hypothetical protein ACIQ8D_22685 [Streptomyces sp. NPDC096094]|uniref:hypothetical protein n=1 Tax=Streptomyces sp. NPDC096094 TaxID=3366073 RepID=UPI003829E218